MRPEVRAVQERLPEQRPNLMWNRRQETEAVEAELFGESSRSIIHLGTGGFLTRNPWLLDLWSCGTLRDL